jgi:hypothetical protein
MMRNPLDRRMFANPQQRRGMARMPQGILASGPRIMKASMQQQEPVRARRGRSVVVGQDVETLSPLAAFLTGSGVSGSSPEGTINRGRGRTPGIVNPAPGSGIEPNPNVDSTQEGDVNFSDNPVVQQEIILPAPVDGAPYPQPGAVDSGTGGLKTPAPRTDDETETEGSSTTALMKMLEDLRNRRSGDDKSTKEYVEEANALLKEFGIDAPDLKGRKDLRIMEFFLNVAAGQSPDALTNVAQAGKESFKGYGEDVREVEAAEQKLKLAGLEMGLAEKARTQATEQAILLKEFDIAADAFEKITDLPDKSQQIQVLRDVYNVPVEEAIKMVYPERTTTLQGYEIRRDDFIKMGHSPTVATYLSAGGATLLASLAEGNPIGDQIAAAAVAGGGSLTPQDAKILGIQTTSVGN